MEVPLPKKKISGFFSVQSCQIAIAYRTRLEMLAHVGICAEEGQREGGLEWKRVSRNVGKDPAFTYIRDTKNSFASHIIILSISMGGTMIDLMLDMLIG